MSSYIKKGEEAIDKLLKEHGNKTIADIPVETMEKGAHFVKRFLEVYGDIPMVEIVNETWESRKKTNLIKWLLLNSDISIDTLAEYLGCSKQYLNNKFNRDSFSIEDLIIAAFACDYTVALLSNDGSSKRHIDAESFFDEDKETWRRISNLKNDSVENKRAEYEQKKAELERMKEEYGFDD